MCQGFRGQAHQQHSVQRYEKKLTTKVTAPKRAEAWLCAFIPKDTVHHNPHHIFLEI